MAWRFELLGVIGTDYIHNHKRFFFDETDYDVSYFGFKHKKPVNDQAVNPANDKLHVLVTAKLNLIPLFILVAITKAIIKTILIIIYLPFNIF